MYMQLYFPAFVYIYMHMCVCVHVRNAIEMTEAAHVARLTLYTDK